MYQIYVDGQLLYSPMLAAEGYNVLQPRVSMQLNKAGSLTFAVPQNNPMYGSLQRLKSIVTVYQDGTELFRGRILHDERDFYNRKSVYCEGELAFLLDSIQRPFEYQGDIPELFEQFVRNHNDQVEVEKQFEIGKITVTDPNRYINRSNSKHSDTLEALEDKLIKTHGGYLRTRAEGGIRYLDYVADYGSISGQTIEFGKNLLDLSEYISAEDIATVLIPLGAEQEDGSRLTVESINDGKDYIENQTGIELFGRIVKTQEWDDVTLPQNLLKKGQASLQESIELSVSINIKAVDLHLIDVDTDSIKLGDYVRVVSTPHGLDRLFLCSAVKLDLVNPDQTEYTLGVALKGLTEKQIEQQKKAASNVDAVQGISKNALVTAEGAVAAAEQASEDVNVIEQTIAQLPARYVSRSEFETYREEAAEELEEYAKIEDIPTIQIPPKSYQRFAGGTADADRFFNGYVSINGTIEASNAYMCTAHVKMIAGEHLRYKASASSSAWILSECDSSGNFIAGLVLGDNKYHDDIFTADRDMLLRICSRVTTATFPAVSVQDFEAFEQFEQERYYEDVKSSRLYGKTIAFIGDSTAYGNMIGNSVVWLHRLALDYNMTAHNLGINGNSVARYTGQTDVPMCERYVEIPESDFIVLIGGSNDKNKSVPLGDVSSNDTTTFCGALNVTIDGLRALHPKAHLLFFTLYSRQAYANGIGLMERDYADAMISVCKSKSVPCYDNFTMCGLNLTDANLVTWADEGVSIGRTASHHLSLAAYNWLYPKYVKTLEGML